MRFILAAILIALFAASCMTPAAQRLGRVPSSGGSSQEKPEEEAPEEAEESEDLGDSDDSEESEEDREVDDSKPF